ncbi:hypothetical protein [Aerococcus sp. 1KP-2016]|uniref:hypothetical protein n=1 Tax=Aerococcus sp. 1KP-2016 TaxID=1981982 RepID=UPI000B98E94E|nr:hypothetical protein [Aerococcus sp. 1KP-2016]OYQ65965.1 hypothetical protein B9P78_07120 [Aerococcus sp. 1KP-2016]
MNSKNRKYLGIGIMIVLILIARQVLSKSPEEKAYEALMEYVNEEYPISNKEFDIEYPSFKELLPAAIVTGRNTNGNTTWDISSQYTFNPEKVEEALAKSNEFVYQDIPDTNLNMFGAYVELTENGDYIISEYWEGVSYRDVVGE